MRKTQIQKKRRQKRIFEKTKVSGLPRLSVFRSSKHIYASLVNSEEGKTLFSVSDKDLGKDITKAEKAKEVGKQFAEKAIKNKVKKIVFDRSGYLYHGRVKALAEGAREGGLEF